MSGLSVRAADPAWPRWFDDHTDDATGSPWCAADESGWNGDNLEDADDVIAHAVVRIDDKAATPILNDLRDAAGVTQPSEVKFKHFRKPAGLAVVAGALGPGGPLNGRVKIAVADKKYAIVANMMSLLVEPRIHARGENPHASYAIRQRARTLYNDGPRALHEYWAPLCSAFVSLARVTNRRSESRETVESFFQRLEEARSKCTRRNVEKVLVELLGARDQAEWLAEALAGGDLVIPPLDPLVNLFAVSLQSCASYGPTRLLHDQQKLFTREVVESMFEGLRDRPVLPRIVPRPDLDDFCMGDSRSHPSIQIADLMASAGRVVITAQIGRPSRAADVLREAVLPHIAEPWLLPFDGPWRS